MNRRLLLSAGVAIAATVAGGYTLLGRNKPQPAPAPAADDPVAGLMQLQLPDLSGATHSLAAWKGQPIVVNFWATWCAPCVKEMPVLDALQKKYPQIRFVGIGVDSAANMQKFVEKVQVPIRCGSSVPVPSIPCVNWVIPVVGCHLPSFSMQMAALTGKYWVKSSPMT